MRLLLAVLALAGALTAARADIPCDVVRSMAPAARAMPPHKQRELARKYHVTRKMIRQARACLSAGRA